MIEKAVSFEAFRPLISGSHIQETESSFTSKITISNMEKGQLSEAFSLVENFPDYFGYFNVRLVYSDQSKPSLQILNKSGGSLQVNNQHDDRALPEWFSEYQRSASYYVREGKYTDLAEEINELQLSSGADLEIRYKIKKSEITQIVEDELLGEAEEKSNYSVSFWKNERTLNRWVLESNPERVVKSMFDAEKLPIFVFLEKHTEPDSKQLLPFLEVSELEAVTFDRFSENRLTYTDIAKNDGNIARKYCGIEVASPRIFKTMDQQAIFSNILVYSAYAILSDQVKESPSGITFTIEAEKDQITGILDGYIWNIRNGTTLHQDLILFLSEFVTRGDSEVYRNLWHKAIVEHCNQFEEIPERQEDILHYYQSLEEEAIKGNFDDLSSAVQDAQIFLGDVTNTLSDSTVNLTSEIQRLVFALFGAIAANLFLLVQESTIDTAVGFTIAFIAGLLLIYFPISQERIDEVSRIVDEGKKDTNVYTNLAESVGSEDFVDTGQFEERQEAYINLAKNRTEWATNKLEFAFKSLSIVWGIATSYVFYFYTVASIHFLLAVSSVLIVGWMRANHSSKDYYPEFIHKKIPLDPMITVLGLMTVGPVLRIFQTGLI